VTRAFARWALSAAALALIACGSEPNPPATVDCSAVQPTTLVAGQYTIIDASQTACVRIPGPGSADAQYLYVAAATEGRETNSGVTSPYNIQGGASATASVASLSQAALERTSTPAQAFHFRLRSRERELAARAGVVSESRARISASVVPTPPVVGAKRTFDVCATTTCDSFVPSLATAKVVGQRVAIFVDDDAPAGYTQTDLDNVGQLFDSHLYPIDTTAFGRESDLDNNGVVIVLLTQRVNELSPDCQTTGSVILGYFFGLDLLPSQSHSNDGEIFYGAVPGTVSPGCTISRADAIQSLPGVFIHEFQHMISFNQHVLVRGSGTAEDTWLNEGLSHFAEELGGENVPDNFCMPAFPSCESQFNGDNITNAYRYLDSLELKFLIEPGSSSGTLAERGANWLFVRWLADHFAATEPQGTELTQKLVQTSLTGSANVAAATGEDFSTLVSQWQLANYLTDLPGFTPSTDRLTYTTLNLRSIFQANFGNGIFQKPYPLTPDETSDATYQHSGVLRAGSGKHVLITRPAGSGEIGFILTSGGNSSPIPSSVKPRIALARVQ
jgi:hypothetical protein